MIGLGMVGAQKGFYVAQSLVESQLHEGNAEKQYRDGRVLSWRDI